MCKAVEAPADPLSHYKTQRLVKQLSKLPETRQGVFDNVRSSSSFLSVTVGVAPANTADLLRLLVAATLTVVACSLVSHSLLGWFGPLFETGALLAEDLGALVLLLLLWLLAGRLQRCVEATPPRSPRRSNESALLEDAGDDENDEDFGLEATSTGYGAGSIISSGRQRRAQKRRHSLRHALDQLRDVVRSVSAGSSGDVADQELPRYGTRANVAPCGLYNFHAAARGFLLPVEVAACQYAPDVSEHLQRLLEDRWAVLATGGFTVPLASIPE